MRLCSTCTNLSHCFGSDVLSEHVIGIHASKDSLSDPCLIMNIVMVSIVWNSRVFPLFIFIYKLYDLSEYSPSSSPAFLKKFCVQLYTAFTQTVFDIDEIYVVRYQLSLFD